MPSRIIKPDNIDSIDKDVITIRDLYKDDQISIAEILLDGENRLVTHLESDSWYYVANGNGRFIINDLLYQVKEGDLVYIQKGDMYADFGKMKLLCINIPPYKDEDVLEP